METENKFNEPVLQHYDPIRENTLYVCDGEVIKSDIDGTVADLRQYLKKEFGLKAKVITWCDIAGRQRPKMEYKKKCVECGKKFDGKDGDQYCNLMCRLPQLDRYLDSDEGKKSMEEYFAEEKLIDEIQNRQLEKFHNSEFINDVVKLNGLIEKIIKKYDSDEYYFRWINRGIEPPTDLFWFLFYYAEKYLIECKNERYLNMFTGKAYFIGEYVIQNMNGQGSVIRIDKLSDELEKQPKDTEFIFNNGPIPNV